MSAPYTINPDKLAGARCEIISAMSSLNMEPDPIPAPTPDAIYLSERDAHAAHAMEHLHAAFTYAVDATKQYDELLNVVRQLLPELRHFEAPLLLNPRIRALLPRLRRAVSELTP